MGKVVGGKAMTPEREALAYAVALDRTLAAGTDDETSDRITYGVGALLDGLSDKGFVADLTARFDQIEREIIDGAGYPDVWSKRGGNDPDAGISAELQDRIDRATNHEAARWLREAHAIMEPVQFQQEAA